MEVFTLKCLNRTLFKGLVHNFSDNLLTPMSSKLFMSFFLQLKRNEGF